MSSTIERRWIKDPFADGNNHLDVQAGRLYDTISRSKGSYIHRNHRLFVDPIGTHTNEPTNSGPRNRTLADTNMQMCGQLPAPESFSAERLVISFSSLCSDEDVYGFAENFNFVFYLGHKYYINCPIISMRPFDQCKAPIKTCSYCRGVYVGVRCNSCGASEATLLTINGEVQQLGRQFMYEIDPSLIFADMMCMHGELQGEEYRVQCHNDHDVSTFRVWFTFEGLHARGVQ